MNNPNSQTLISVIIRNRNEDEFLKFTLESIKQQQIVAVETIIVDNESTDESIAVARSYNCKILKLPRESFTYGKALNFGIAAASGEICVLLSAHSMLVGPFALFACVETFNDYSIAATRFLHVGKRFDIKRWITPEILSGASDIDTIISKGPLANGCAIRKKVWEEIPFDETVAAAEEKIWSLAVLKRGYKIFSPCPAAYCYLKDLPLNKQIEKNNRELQTIFAETGVKVGHLRENFFFKAKKFGLQILTAPFFVLYKTLIRMVLEFQLLFSIGKPR